MSKPLPLALAAAALTLSPAFAQDAAPYQAPIIANSGAEIGTVAVRGGAKGVVARIVIKAGGLTPGWHGLHFHAVGDCSDKDKFQNAKAHVNHHGAQHGLLSPGGGDEGDLPNIFVAADGSAQAEVSSQRVTLADGAMALKDADGSALIIHAAEDDHASQPIGNSGARVACAVIK